MSNVVELDQVITNRFDCIQPIGTYKDQAVDRLINPKPDDSALLPWPMTHDEVRLRSGEMSVWAGYNGSGKSMVTSQMALSLILQGRKTLICSFEMQPRLTLERMANQYSGENLEDAAKYRGKQYVQQALEDFYKTFNENGLIHSALGIVDPERLMGELTYACGEHKVKHIIIDNLASLIKDADGYNQQKQIVAQLCALARDWNIHVHLVAHLRKPDQASPDRVASKYDIAGSGTIADQADNIWIVHRSKKKERQREAARKTGEAFDEGSQGDALLLCEKQRNGRSEPRYELYYNRNAQSYGQHWNFNPKEAIWK